MPFDHPADRSLEEATSRWMTWGGVLLVAFALAFPIYRLREPARLAAAHEAYTAELTAQGAKAYELNCAQCHGPSGGGGLAPALAARQFLEQASDEQIRQLVAVGVPGTQMGSYLIDYGGPLTQEQIGSIVVFIRSWQGDAQDFALWRTPLAREGLTGKELYAVACSSCHESDLSGDVGPALGAGSDAEEESDSRLAQRIEAGKDEMPAFGNILTPEQISALVGYIRSVQQESSP